MTDYSPLQSEIKKVIKSSGPMPVWRYMELCLTHPRHGYYVPRDPLGREGDFTTAPEVSQMFGELLGLWAPSVWKAIGSPSLLRLIELGPGRGTMMADALRALRVLPPLYQSLSIHLVEINPVLREKQRATLSGVRNLAWHDSIDGVPDGPSVIFANEYFDVLPIHQVVKRETGWHERTVEIDGNAYSVPWRLIGERVRVTVGASSVRVLHGGREVAVHAELKGRRERVVDDAHLKGVAGAPGCPVRFQRDDDVALEPAPDLLRPLAEYDAAIGGSF